MRKELDYNEFGPETCLTDEVFMLLWQFYVTHNVPKTETGRELLKLLDISSHDKLSASEMFDPEKVTEVIIPFLAAKYKVDIPYFKWCVQHGYIFWTFSGAGISWKSCRFADPATHDYSFVSIENLKHTIKELAIEEGLLSGYE